MKIFIPATNTLAISTLISSILNLAISNPCFSLPGDTLQKSIRYINNNELGKGLRFQPFTLNSIVAHYQAIILFKGNNVKIIVGEKAWSMQSDYSEAVFIENSSIGKSLGKTGYNLRQDQEVTKLIHGIWGEAINKDFIKSQIIDKYYEAGTHRITYRGQRFGYIASYGDGHFRYAIYSLKDWQIFRIQGEFEERVK